MGNAPRDTGTPEAAALVAAVTNVAARSHEVMQAFLDRQARHNGGAAADPLGVGRAFMDLTAALMMQPEKVLEAQFNAWNAYVNLWFNTADRLLGRETEPTVMPARGDRRFQHAAWENNPYFNFIKQSYLLAADTIQGVVAEAEGLDPKTAEKVRFYARQFTDALSPTNFAATNPQVLEATLESKGENLLKGLQHFVEDFDPESGRLRIRMADTKAFELGANVAVSPGRVIFQNKLMQLVQYAPSTEQVFRRPLLIVPPWINKFYILDLQPKNSLIKWCVDQGYTVFVISWVNPDASLADMDFEDYMKLGPMAALDAMHEATGEEQANVVGYCIGGTLLGATLAWMTEKGDGRFTSATFLTSLLDFSEPGGMGVFIDEGQLASLEREMNERGYHEGAEMSAVFNMLRANDLIWSFYVNNYLLGKEPVPFDLLYWNSDSTRLPAKMHSTYLRTMYLENRFKDPGGMTLEGVPIDLRAITTPAYFLSTEDDHIAPWRGTYLGAQLLSGPVQFVLGKSGHIAGVVNPPAAGKYGYSTGPSVDVDAERWLGQSASHEGSWWPHWHAWLKEHAGDRVPAREPGAGIEDAPGAYVRKRL